MKSQPPVTYVEIDLKALRHNLRELRRLSARNRFELPTRPETLTGKPQPHAILAVVKAEAYGHGMEQVALALDKAGVEFFGASDIHEGILLRQINIRKPVLLFESTLPEQIPLIVKYGLVPTVCTLDFARKLNAHARAEGRCVDVHVKIDTGMGRLGVWHEEAFEFIRLLQAFRFIRITGLYSHFPAADTDRAFTRRQIEDVYHLVIRLDQHGLVIPYIHSSNSVGLAGYKTHVLNLSRPGLMLYGMYPHAGLKSRVRLKPVMSVKSRVVFIKDIPAGQTISYGRTFTAKKKIRVAVVPIGYHDGYFRALSNKADVLIGGRRCRVLGRVTMDQIMVDVSRVKAAKIGAPVVVMGRQGKAEVPADELAKIANTISYEIVCNIGNRLTRVYKD